jgi:RNA polymerase sigma factor (sigma-70 family)
MKSPSALDVALDSLSPRERAVVVLRHVDALSTRETAAALGVSEGAVKRYLSDAVAKLQRRLDFRDSEPALIKEVQAQ